MILMLSVKSSKNRWLLGANNHPFSKAEPTLNKFQRRETLLESCRTPGWPNHLHYMFSQCNIMWRGQAGGVACEEPFQLMLKVKGTKSAAPMKDTP